MADVVIYTSMLCGYCWRAKRLLEDKGVDFEEIDVSFSRENRARMIERAGGRRTVPQIFVGGRHLGDCDDICAMEAAGELDAALGQNP